MAGAFRSDIRRGSAYYFCGGLAVSRCDPLAYKLVEFFRRQQVSDLALPAHCLDFRVPPVAFRLELVPKGGGNEDVFVFLAAADAFLNVVRQFCPQLLACPELAAVGVQCAMDNHRTVGRRILVRVAEDYGVNLSRKLDLCRPYRPCALVRIFQ